ncbi:MAG: hypothetical protein JO033_25285, partial [Acidobacteriaceae bacterium]|nr:hypothetical protein [Acidobacteriaceae bacterium]
MALIHFLNVKQGDCSIIQHNSERITVIDVCNAKEDSKQNRLTESVTASLAKLDGIMTKAAGSGNFNQKNYPVNPVIYIKDFGIGQVFRFVLTHPDMDHMDGLKVFWNTFSPTNFWDTENTCSKDGDFEAGSPYNQEDWDFYKELRSRQGPVDRTRLTLFSGDHGKYWNQNEDGSSGADGLYILAPNRDLVEEAN